MRENQKEIKTQQDIDDLMEIFYGFHDSCLFSAKYKSGNFVDEENAMCFGLEENYVLEAIFHSQWQEKALVMHFVGVRQCCIAGFQKYYMNEMQDCYLKIHQDLVTGDDTPLIVWADCDGFSPKSEIARNLLQEPLPSYIVANKAYWYLKEKNIDMFGRKKADGYQEFAYKRT